MIFLKLLCLFLICWQGPITIVRACRGEAIGWFSFLTLAIGLTGFIYLQFLM